MATILPPEPCVFTEVQALHDARAFALCQVANRNVYVPVSLPAHRSVRGIDSSHGGSLRVQPRLLRNSTLKVWVGLALPPDYDFAMGTHILNLLADDPCKPIATMTVPPRKGMRYAVLGVVQQSNPGEWRFTVLRTARLFRDKRSLNVTYRVDRVWLSLVG